MSDEYGWWDERSEPKRNFRYRVEIEGFGAVSGYDTQGDPIVSPKLWMAKKVTKPSFSVGEVKANFVDKTFYYPGRVEWNTCEVTLFDPVSPNVVNHFAQMFENSGYFIPKAGQQGASVFASKENWGSTAKSNATNGASVGYVYITTINQDGHRLEEWRLQNTFIKSIKFGDLSYDSDDMTEVTLEIRYDWAELWAYEIKYDLNPNSQTYGLPVGETGRIYKVLGQSRGKYHKKGTDENDPSNKGTTIIYETPIS